MNSDHSPVHSSSSPLVSVIVPNYNHAPYLRRRIDSILSQTYQNFELILMDDCSTDNSREILSAYAARERRTRLLFNDINSGSTFKQWNKGVQEAKGDFIWLAESDDYADPRLLERLVSPLQQHVNVGIAFCESNVIDEKDAILRTTHRDVTHDPDISRWDHDFIANGTALCTQLLTAQNFIPNASAAMFRRSLFEAVGGADGTMRLNGDWKLWAAILLRSDLAHVAVPLNYFRTHTQNVRSTTKLSASLSELISILRFISQNATIDVPTHRRSKTVLADKFIRDWLWCTDREKVELKKLLAEACDLYPGFRRFLYRRIFHRGWDVVRNGKARQWFYHIFVLKQQPAAAAKYLNDETERGNRIGPG